MKRIPLTQGQFALVDDEDYDFLMKWKWYALKGKNTFYAVRDIQIDKKKKTIWLHRVIMNIPEGMFTDHKDHDGCNNQRYNLRNCTKSQNNRNRKKVEGCSSKFKGSCWNKRAKSWFAYIKVGPKLKSLGYFKNEIEAALAYNIAAKELFKEFAELNEV